MRSCRRMQVSTADLWEEIADSVTHGASEALRKEAGEGRIPREAAFVLSRGGDALPMVARGMREHDRAGMSSELRAGAVAYTSANTDFRSTE